MEDKIVGEDAIRNKENAAGVEVKDIVANKGKVEMDVMDQLVVEVDIVVC